MADINLKDIDAELQRRATASGAATPPPMQTAQSPSLSIDDINKALQQNGIPALPAGVQLPSQAVPSFSTQQPDFPARTQQQPTPPQQGPQMPDLFATMRGQMASNEKLTDKGPDIGVNTNFPGGPDLQYRFVKGAKDVADGLAQLTANSLPTPVINAGNSVATWLNNNFPVTKSLGITPTTPQQMNQDIQNSEKQYQDYRKQGGQSGFDGPRLLGNVVGSLPISYVVPAPPAAGSLIKASLVAGQAGAANAAAMPVTQSGDYWTNKKQQLGIGTLIGLLTGPIAPAVNKIMNPSVSPDVQYLVDRGVMPTTGQIIGPTAAKTEDKLSSIPVLGDLIKGAQKRALNDYQIAAYNDVLAPIGQKVSTTDIGNKGIAALDDKISQAYDDLLPKLTWQLDNQVASDVGAVRQAAAQLPQKEASQVEGIVKTIVGQIDPNTGTMAGDVYKTLDSHLGKLSRDFSGATDAYQKQLGGLVTNLRTAMKDALDRSNPQYAGDLKAIDTAKAMYYRVAGAAGKIGANEGVFTPNQLMNSVRQMDSSTMKGQFAKGDALLQPLAQAGKNVLSSTYPDSGTAGRGLIAALLAGSYFSPKVAAGVAAASLPYTESGQNLMANILTKRPQTMRQLAPMVSNLLTPIGQTAVPLLLGPANGQGLLP